MPNPFKIGSIAYDNWNYENPGEARDVVGEAKGALSRADQLTSETGSARLARLPASLAALRQPVDERGPVRRFTEPLASAGNTAMLAGIPAGAVNPVIGGAMLTGGGLATLPDYLRKLIAPEGDESRPGVVETGMAGLAALPAVGALRGLKAGLQEAGPAVGAITRGQSIARDAALGMGEDLGTAGYKFNSAASSNPVEELMQTPSFRNLPKSTKITPSPRPAMRSDMVSPEYDAELGRVLRGDAPPFSETGTPVPGEIYHPTNDTSGRWMSPTQQGMLADIEAYRKLGPSSNTPLDPMQKLAARSMERFGKRYRKE